MQKILLLISFGILFTSCDYFQTQPDEDAIAKVGDNYLYKSDITSLKTSGISKEDSAQLVNSFIQKWATTQLLMEKAKMNLAEEKQQQYENLVEDYKTELYTKGYIDILAIRELDSTITNSELETYYNQNESNFLLNEDLVQLRYVLVDEEYTKLKDLKAAFQRYEKEDREDLENKAIQFKSYSFNDSVWVKATTVVEKIPALEAQKKEELLKKSNYIELEDSLGVYLIQIKDVLLRNEKAPLSYVKPTIEQIILNRRKLEQIRKLEKEILEDAIKTKKFETFQ